MIYHLDSPGCPGLPVPSSFLPEKAPSRPLGAGYWGDLPVAALAVSRGSRVRDIICPRSRQGQAPR